MSISKGKKRNAGREIIHLHKNNKVLKPNDPLLFFIQRIRDEAHRFAITFHRLKRSKRAVYSALDAIPGIGRVKKKQLMEKFGSIQNIKESPLDVIATTPGVNEKLAKIIKQHLRVSSGNTTYTSRSK